MFKLWKSQLVCGRNLRKTRWKMCKMKRLSLAFSLFSTFLYHRDDKYTSCPLLNDLYKYKALLKNRSAFFIKLVYFLKKSTIWSKASSSLLVNAEGAAVVGATGSVTGGATSRLAVVDLI